MSHHMDWHYNRLGVGPHWPIHQQQAARKCSEKGEEIRKDDLLKCTNSHFKNKRNITFGPFNIVSNGVYILALEITHTHPVLWRFAHLLFPLLCINLSSYTVWPTTSLFCPANHIIWTWNRCNKALLSISDVSLSLVVLKCQTACLQIK